MDKKCFYCSDEDDRMDTCTCGHKVCDKCMVGRGDSSAVAGGIIIWYVNKRKNMKR
jgi:hypothetical protein